MTNTDLAVALLEVDGLRVELGEDSVHVSRDLDTDDRVSLSDACRAVFEAGGEIRDVAIDPDRERLELEARVDA